MEKPGLLARMKIKTKIVVSFFLLVMILSSLLVIWSYLSMTRAVKHEFTQRVINDTLSFTKSSTESLLLGDIDTVTKNMSSRLGSDLVAILVYDVQGDNTPYYQVAGGARFVSESGFLKRLDKENVTDVSDEMDPNAVGATFSKFSEKLKENGQYGYAQNIDYDGSNYLICTTSGYFKDESLSSDAAEPANDAAGLLDGLDMSGDETPATEGDAAADDASIDLTDTISTDATDTLTLDAGASGADATSDVDPELMARVFFVYSQERIEKVAAGALTFALVLIVLATGLSLLLGLLLAKHLTSPIEDVVQVLKDMAEGEGDLSVRLATQNEDELGELCMWFNTFVGKLNQLITRMDKTSNLLGEQLALLHSNIDLLQTNVNTTDTAFHSVAHVAESLQAGIGTISDGTDTSHSEMENVAEGARELTRKFSDVATSIQQSTDNLSEVASAVEQLSATFQEISRNMDHNKNTTNQAAQLSDKASDSVRVLDEHARNISDFVQIIDAISKQTNLLALNATIEAASAGEAGKGFAVVAKEVKDLAKQTAQAVQQIGHRVHEIQQSTNSTISHIDEISRVMDEVSTINNSIVASIEEQATTVQEIHKNLDDTSHEAESISQAVQNSLDISIGVSESCESAFNNTTKVRHVSRDILESSKVLAEKSAEAKVSATEMVSALGSSYTSVTDLSQAAQSMLAITRKFKYIDEDSQEQ